MGATGRDGRDVRVAPHQQHFFRADMARQHAALRKESERDSFREIGTCRVSVLFGHGTPRLVTHEQQKRSARVDFLRYLGSWPSDNEAGRLWCAQVDGSAIYSGRRGIGESKLDQ